MIIDFRARPPYKSFLNILAFDKIPPEKEI